MFKIKYCVAAVNTYGKKGMKFLSMLFRMGSIVFTGFQIGMIEMFFGMTPRKKPWTTA